MLFDWQDTRYGFDAAKILTQELYAYIKYLDTTIFYFDTKIYKNIYKNEKKLHKKDIFVRIYSNMSQMQFYNEMHFYLTARRKLLAERSIGRGLNSNRIGERTRNFFTVSSLRAFDFRPVIESHLKRRRSLLSGKTERDRLPDPRAIRPLNTALWSTDKYLLVCHSASRVCHLAELHRAVLP